MAALGFVRGCWGSELGSSYLQGKNFLSVEPSCQPSFSNKYIWRKLLPLPPFMGGHKAWEHKILTSNAVKETYSFYLTCWFSRFLLRTLERSLCYYLWNTLQGMLESKDTSRTSRTF